MEKTPEAWKSPRKIEEERRELRLKVGNALANCVLEGVMTPKDAKRTYNQQFPETAVQEPTQ